MAAKWEQWNIDPNLNTSSPPNGAPENMPARTINDTMRLIMAAIKELGNELRTGAPDANPEGEEFGFDDLGSMAKQFAGNVDINGGDIGGNVTIDASRLTNGTIPQARIPKVNAAIKADFLATGASSQVSAQTLYDWMHPVTSVMIFDTGEDTSAPPPTVPTGITATWTRIAEDRYLRIKKFSTTPPRMGGANTGKTGKGGVHDHGGKTGNPNVKNISPAEITMPSADSSTTRTHDHSIFNTGTSHDHDMTIEPEYYSVTVYRRTA